MFKIKPIVFAASGAFVLSFFIALVSKHGILIPLLNAFIFAIVFAALTLGIEFVFAKFFADSSSGEVQDVQVQKTVGGKVDLVVSEEDLSDDSDSPSFFVEGRHIISSDDVGKSEESPFGAITASAQNAALDAAEEVRSQKAAQNIVASAASQAAKAAPESPPAGQTAPGAEGFVPLDLTAQNVKEASLQKEPAAQAPVAPAAQDEPSANDASPVPPAPASSGDEELDELPDIGELSDAGATASAEEEVIEDSEFAEEGAPVSIHRTEMPDGKVADVKDAGIMAEAIRTVLKKEEG